MVLSNLGMTYASRKNWEQATMHLERGAQIFEELQDPNGIIPLRALAFIYFRRGKWGKAFGCLRRANHLSKQHLGKRKTEFIQKNVAVLADNNSLQPTAKGGG